MPRTVQNSFTGGELSPAVQMRFDLAKVQVGLAQCRNMIVDPHGGVRKRTGLRFIDEVKNSSDTEHRLVDFAFSTSQTYTLLFGPFYMRVFRDSAVVVDSSEQETVSAITEASGTITVTTAFNHGWATGQQVYINGVTGMTEINGRRYDITVTALNEFTLQGVDGSGWGAYVSGGTVDIPFELATPYPAADLAELNWTQSADVLTMVHVNHPQAEFTRTADDAWTRSEISFEPDVQPPINGSTGASGTVDFKITSVAIDTAEESTALLIVNSSAAGGVILDWDPPTSGPEVVKYNVYQEDTVSGIFGFIGVTSASTFEIPAGGITPEISDTPPTNRDPFSTDWVVLGATASGSPTNLEITGHGFQTGDSIVLSDLAGGTWTNLNGNTYIITVVDVDNITIDVDSSGFGTYTASTGNANHGNRQKPGAVTYYQQRIVYGGSTDHPQRIWMSVSGSFHNFSVSDPVKADDAVTFTLAARQVNAIRHFVPLSDLLVMTVGGEWRVLGDQDNAITPTSIALVPQSFRGSSFRRPITSGNSTLFVQNHDTQIRDLAYTLESDGYDGNDLTVLAAHLFGEHGAMHTIRDWAYAQLPNSLVWVVRSDGTAASLTYLKEHQVWGWSRHDTDGLFEANTAIREDPEDTVYFVVARTVGGVTRRYVEATVDGDFDDVLDAFYVDSGLTLDNPYPITNISVMLPPVVTATAHPFVQDDVVCIDSVKGTTEVNDLYWKVGVVSGDNFELLPVTPLVTLQHANFHARGKITAATNTNPAVFTAPYNDGADFQNWITDNLAGGTWDQFNSPVVQRHHRLVSGDDFYRQVDNTTHTADSISNEVLAEFDGQWAPGRFPTGQAILIFGAIGDWAGINGVWIVTNTEEGGDEKFTIPFNSVGLPTYAFFTHGGTIVSLVDGTNLGEYVRNSGDYDQFVAGADPVGSTFYPAHGVEAGTTVRFENLAGGTWGTVFNGNDYVVEGVYGNAFDVDAVEATGSYTQASGRYFVRDYDTTFSAYESGGNVRKAETAVSGLSHLAGKTVSVLADGNVSTAVVDQDGAITLPEAACRVHVGLGYTAEFETFDAVSNQQRGPSIGAPVKTTEIILRVLDSRGFEAGPSGDQLFPAKWRTDEVYGAATREFTGDVRLIPHGDWTKSGRVFVRQAEPLPLNVLAVTREVQFGD